MKMSLVPRGEGSSEPGGSRELPETPLEPRQECHTKILSGSVTIKRTASDCQTETVKTKLLPVGITIKSTDRECHD